MGVITTAAKNLKCFLHVSTLQHVQNFARNAMHGSKFPDTKHGENSGYSKIERKTSLPVELIFVVLLGTITAKTKHNTPLRNV